MLYGTLRTTWTCHLDVQNARHLVQVITRYIMNSVHTAVSTISGKNTVTKGSQTFNGFTPLESANISHYIVLLDTVK